MLFVLQDEMAIRPSCGWQAGARNLQWQVGNTRPEHRSNSRPRKGLSAGMPWPMACVCSQRSRRRVKAFAHRIAPALSYRELTCQLRGRLQCC